MPKYTVQYDKIAAKMAPIKLPASFKKWCTKLASAQYGEWGWFSVKPSSLKHHLPKKLHGDFQAFMHMPDGSLMAFWLQDKSISGIVHLSHDGELVAIANTWDEFLTRWQRGKTEVPDVDERDGSSDAPMIAPAVKLAPRRKLRSQLDKLKLSEDSEFESSTGTDASSKKAAGEALAKALYVCADKHKLFPKNYQIVDLVLTLTSRTYDVQYYHGGLQPFPWPQEIHAELLAWSKAIGRSLKKSELSVWKDGTIFFEKNTKLVFKVPQVVRTYVGAGNVKRFAVKHVGGGEYSYSTNLAFADHHLAANQNVFLESPTVKTDHSYSVEIDEESQVAKDCIESWTVTKKGVEILFVKDAWDKLGYERVELQFDEAPWVPISEIRSRLKKIVKLAK